jgi:hypothetical protein
LNTARSRKKLKLNRANWGDSAKVPAIVAMRQRGARTPAVSRVSARDPRERDSLPAIAPPYRRLVSLAIIPGLTSGANLVGTVSRRCRACDALQKRYKGRAPSTARVATPRPAIHGRSDCPADQWTTVNVEGGAASRAQLLPGASHVLAMWPAPGAGTACSSTDAPTGRSIARPGPAALDHIAGYRTTWARKGG